MERVEEVHERGEAAAAVGRSAIFGARGRDGRRSLHAVVPGAGATVCGLPIGAGSGLTRDGDYRASAPCSRCWP